MWSMTDVSQVAPPVVCVVCRVYRARPPALLGSGIMYAHEVTCSTHSDDSSVASADGFCGEAWLPSPEVADRTAMEAETEMMTRTVERERTRSRAKDEVDDVYRRLEEAEMSLVMKDARLREVTTDLTAARDEYERLKAKYINLSEAYEGVVEELSLHTSAGGRGIGAGDWRRGGVHASSMSTLCTAEGEHDYHRQRADALQAELDAAQAEIAVLMQQWSGAERCEAEVQTDGAALEDTLDTAALVEELEQCREALREMQWRHEAALGECSRLEWVLEQQQPHPPPALPCAACEQLREDCALLQSDLAQARDDLAAAENHVDATDTRYRRLLQAQHTPLRSQKATQTRMLVPEEDVICRPDAQVLPLKRRSTGPASARSTISSSVVSSLTPSTLTLIDSAVQCASSPLRSGDETALDAESGCGDAVGVPELPEHSPPVGGLSCARCGRGEGVERGVQVQMQPQPQPQQSPLRSNLADLHPRSSELLRRMSKVTGVQFASQQGKATSTTAATATPAATQTSLMWDVAMCDLEERLVELQGRLVDQQWAADRARADAAAQRDAHSAKLKQYEGFIRAVAPLMEESVDDTTADANATVAGVEAAVADYMRIKGAMAADLPASLTTRSGGSSSSIGETVVRIINWVSAVYDVASGLRLAADTAESPPQHTHRSILSLVRWAVRLGNGLERLPSDGVGGPTLPCTEYVVQACRHAVELEGLEREGVFSTPAMEAVRAAGTNGDGGVMGLVRWSVDLRNAVTDLESELGIAHTDDAAASSNVRLLAWVRSMAKAERFVKRLEASASAAADKDAAAQRTARAPASQVSRELMFDAPCDEDDNAHDAEELVPASPSLPSSVDAAPVGRIAQLYASSVSLRKTLRRCATLLEDLTPLVRSELTVDEADPELADLQRSGSASAGGEGVSNGALTAFRALLQRLLRSHAALRGEKSVADAAAKARLVFPQATKAHSAKTLGRVHRALDLTQGVKRRLWRGQHAGSAVGAEAVTDLVEVIDLLEKAASHLVPPAGDSDDAVSTSAASVGASRPLRSRSAAAGHSTAHHRAVYRCAGDYEAAESCAQSTAPSVHLPYGGPSECDAHSLCARDEREMVVHPARVVGGARPVPRRASSAGCTVRRSTHEAAMHTQVEVRAVASSASVVATSAMGGLTRSVTAAAGARQGRVHAASMSAAAAAVQRGREGPSSGSLATRRAPSAGTATREGIRARAGAGGRIQRSSSASSVASLTKRSLTPPPAAKPSTIALRRPLQGLTASALNALPSSEGGKVVRSVRGEHAPIVTQLFKGGGGSGGR